jgi:deoxyribonuclease V
MPLSAADPAAWWPVTIPELEAEQVRLGAARPAPWTWPEAGASDPLAAPSAAGGIAIGGCFVCFGRGGGGAGRAGDAGWAAAAVWRDGVTVATATACGSAGAPYDAGHLALREGPLLEAAVRALPILPAVLLVNSTGRDHPRRAGLALHLGARVEIPTVGVTNRLLASSGVPPGEAAGADSPFAIEGEITGFWVRIRPATRALAAHAGWCTDPACALAIVLACTPRARTPEPLRAARRAAREARTRASQSRTFRV